MYLYKAYIGRSSYDIPYEKEEDLQELKEICKEVNTLINTIISQDRTATNEFALVLAVVNLIYENKTLKSESSPIQISQEKTYTSQQLLDVIQYMNSKIKC